MTNPKTCELDCEQILSEVTDLVSIVDATGTYEYASPSHEVQLGFSPQSLLGTNAMDIVHPDDRNKATDILKQAFIYPGKPHTAELRLKDSTGNWQVFESHGRVFTTGAHLPKGIIISRNLTATRNAQAQALSDSERYHTLFEQMQQGIVIGQMIFSGTEAVDFKFLEVNPAFTTLTGLSNSQVVNKRVSETIPKLERQVIETLGTVVTTGQPTKFNQFMLAFNKTFEIHAYRPKDGQFATIFQDISDQITANNELKRKNQELEKTNRLMVDRELKMIELKKTLSKYQS